MTRHRDFHESYYEHNCTVSGSQDVLESDIPGHLLINKLKRWWYGLFLVSYSDKQARLYFRSSHAMRLERYKQYRNYRNRIHPLSKFRNFRDVFMFMLFLLNTVIFHHNTSITFGQLFRGFYYLGALMEWIILADVVVNCQTGYIDTDSGKIILDKRLGLLHYASTKLFVHVASALPLQCVLLLRYGTNVDCTICKINYFTTILKLLSGFGLFRMYEHTSFLTWERNNYAVTHFFKFLRIYLVGMMIMLYYIATSEAVTLMYMISNGKLIDDAYVTSLIRHKFVHPEPPSCYTFFVSYFGRITKSILLFNISVTLTKYHLDIIATIIGYVIANLIYLYQILECYDFLSTLCFLDEKVFKLKQTLGNLVHCRQLPNHVTKKLDSYYDYNQSKVRAMEQSSSFLDALPVILKTEALLARHTRLVKRIPCFSEWPLEVIEGVVLMLKEEIYLTNDLVAEGIKIKNYISHQHPRDEALTANTIASENIGITNKDAINFFYRPTLAKPWAESSPYKKKPWVQSEGLLMVGMGELAVYNGEIETGHLIDGDYFGELSLVTNNELRTSRVVAVTPCVMLLLEKSAFRGYMRQYPELFTALKQGMLNGLGLKSNNITK